MDEKSDDKNKEPIPSPFMDTFVPPSPEEVKAMETLGVISPNELKELMDIMKAGSILILTSDKGISLDDARKMFNKEMNREIRIASFGI